MTDYKIVTGGSGPGSQPSEEDGADLSFMQMPSEMQTYQMPEVTDAISSLAQANDILAQVQATLDNYQENGAGSIDLSMLDEKNRELIDQVLGEGEVSIVFSTGSPVRIQESVLAGVWRIQFLSPEGEIEKDAIEVADIPHLVKDTTFAGKDIQKVIKEKEYPGGVNNAIPLISELNDKIKEDDPAQAHVINLTLLPQTEEDIAFLTQCLGKGPVTILSRGYGNCRVTSTATHNVWWVQYFNTQDAIILNTLEVTPVPSVVCASQEDIDDSAERLKEIREVYA